MRTNRFILPLLLLCLFTACSTQRDLRPTASTTREAKREFRGAWIQTAFQGEYKSMSPAVMRKTFIKRLDFLQQCGINAIVFQVRPEADAFYASKLEPWSRFLTGTQGQAPAGRFDPMAFLIEECHKRNMEFHAWLNPYRARMGSETDLASNHIYFKHPEWFVTYNKQLLFDPGLPACRQFICKVVQDIVSRYDVDAIHMDDYFYPYPVKGHSIPDRATYEANPRGFSNINDWRRDNVNTIIRELHTVIHSLKPEVQFGISPFGVYRNDSTLGIRAGMTNYDDLYADIVLWMKEGWIDYVVPQLYWEIGRKGVDYATLARWWADNSHGCRLYIGIAPYRLLNQPTAKQKTSAWATGNEIMRQLRLNDSIPEIQGECFYSTRPLLKNPRHLCDSLKDRLATERPR